MDIHNHSLELQKSLASLSKRTDLSEKNRVLIRKFVESLIVQNYSKPRVIKYIDTAMRVARLFKKDYELWASDDIQQYLAAVHNQSHSPWTIQWYKVFIRRLMQYIHNMSGKDYPELVAKIKVHVPDNLRRLPNDGELLTADEISRIITCCKNSRDRAFIAALSESGCRIGELGNMALKHIKFDQYGGVLSVTGKTGARQVRVIHATPYLAAWLHDHPLKNNKESPLWVQIESKAHRQVGYQRWRQLLIELGKQASVEKRVNPHSFRHARATHLANHMTSFQMNQYLGWKQGSEMPSTYIHLSGKNTDNALLKMYGLETKDEKADDMKPLKCTRCDSINPHGAQFCVKCGMVLSEVAAAEIDENVKLAQQEQAFGAKAMSQLLKDPEVLELLKKKLTQVTA